MPTSAQPVGIGPPVDLEDIPRVSSKSSRSTYGGGILRTCGRGHRRGRGNSRYSGTGWRVIRTREARAEEDGVTMKTVAMRSMMRGL